MRVTATVERNDNNYYMISSSDEIMSHCLGGYGYSVAEAKNDFFRSIEEAKEMIVESGGQLPPEAEEIHVEFRYDIPSFFNYFDWINISAFAKQAGINESKMRAYKAGISTASEKTLNKIRVALRKMCAAMSDASL